MRPNPRQQEAGAWAHGNGLASEGIEVMQVLCGRRAQAPAAEAHFARLPRLMDGSLPAFLIHVTLTYATPSVLHQRHLGRLR